MPSMGAERQAVLPPDRGISSAEKAGELGDHRTISPRESGPSGKATSCTIAAVGRSGKGGPELINRQVVAGLGGEEQAAHEDFQGSRNRVMMDIGRS